jgi:membrane-associated phospholipid phosphatase
MGPLILGSRLAVLPLLSAILQSAVLQPANAADVPIPPTQSVHSQDRAAGGWKTWVLSSGSEMRLPAPPDSDATARELEDLRKLSATVTPDLLDKIKYWDFRSPPHAWNDLMIEFIAASPLAPGYGPRAFAMLNVALHDAMIAAWDSKYAYNRPRPAEVDPSIGTLLPARAYPSYPCEHSVAAGAAAAVLLHIYPKEAERIKAAAEEARMSPVTAGSVFPSDSRMGFELGRNVAVKVIEHMRLKDPQPAGPSPQGPGIWKGISNPPGLNDMHWKRFVLDSPDQFRPGSPPAHDSQERAAELAEVRNFKRTPFTNSKVFYWQYGQRGGPAFAFGVVDEVGKQLAVNGAHASPPKAARAYALATVAQYEGWIASQDAKFHYWAARPNQIDPTVTTVIDTPPFPSYPSNNATIVNAPAVVLSYLFPREKHRYEAMAHEAGESRLWAGIHFRSDITTGNLIGQKVGEAVIARARSDGS